MRAIVVGTGAISNAWFPAIKAHQVDVAGLVDINPEQPRAQAQKYELGEVPIFTDLDEALQKVTADFAIDLTPPAVHSTTTCRSLEAGLHVIGEKPMAESLEDCQRMCETARRMNRLYMVSQSRRYHPLHQQIADTVSSGVIGPITHAHCEFFRGVHFGGFRTKMQHVLLNDMSIHHFDMARMFLQLDPQSVFAESYNPQGSWYAHGANANCLFTMDGDVRFTYLGSWCSEGSHTAWAGHWRIVGTQGAIIYENEQTPRVYVAEPGEGGTWPAHEVEPAAVREFPEGQSGALAEFLRSLQGGPAPQGECHDNIKSMSMVLRAMQSADEGVRLTCDLESATTLKE